MVNPMSTPSLPEREAVALIGTGVMGQGMGLRLLGAGFPLRVHNRTPAKAEPLLAAGAEWRATVADAVADVAFVITMVGLPDEVRTVYFGPDGILDHARPGSVLIDMGTSPPALAREIAARAIERGMLALDAPVSGGEIGAREGTLSIMVGGEVVAFERARPLFEAMGKTIVHHGPAGSGQNTKLCNQIVVAGNMIGACEALVYARAAGLDPENVLRSIRAGAAASWALDHLYPRMVQADFAPGFYVRHFLKDMAIALAEAERLGISLPGLSLVHRLYQRVAELGGADLGTQALILALDELAGDSLSGPDEEAEG